MRQEIVSDEEDEEDPVVDGSFEIEGEGSSRDVEEDFEVLSENGDVEEDEGFGFGEGFVGFDDGFGST